MSTPRVLAAGDRAWLAELDTLDEALVLFRLAEAKRLAGVTEIVPAARTVLIQFDPVALPAARAREWLANMVQALAVRGVAGDGAGATAAREVVIPVRYTGEDLDDVCRMLSLTRAQLIARHTGQAYQCAFAGFSPGFMYLSGGDPCFAGVTRRSVPRTRVPAGSVAVAAGFCAVYPSDSPGGWRLLGRTPLRMWDLQRTEPALLQPGWRVRFRDMDASGAQDSLPCGDARALSPSLPLRATAATPLATSWLEVLDPGVQTLFQDGGRLGMTRLGIPRSGALDRAALRAANRLVGNRDDAPGLENALGGLQLRCHGQATVAVTGARVAVSLANASGMRLPAATDNALELGDGQVLRLGRPRAGMRSYVAVAGGWAVDPVLGSCSTDVLAGVGPPALARGDVLRIRAPAAVGVRPRMPVAGRLARLGETLPRMADLLTVRVTPGPRADWFDAAALRDLTGQEWRVTPQSNRVGLRLAGDHPLLPVRSAELASEGMVTGAVQVPHGGQPVVFLADHPLTGGYPVIAVVVDADLDRLGQLPPGGRLRFRMA